MRAQLDSRLNFFCGLKNKQARTLETLQLLIPRLMLFFLDSTKITVCTHLAASTDQTLLRTDVKDCTRNRHAVHQVMWSLKLYAVDLMLKSELEHAVR